MIQRYKVFIYDLPIHFRNTSDILDLECKVLKYKDLDLEEFFQQLTNKKLTGPLALIGEDVEMIWSSFSKMFKGVIAAGGVVFKEDDVLIIKRLGRTDLPKGKLEKGEWIDECAIREVEEECAIDQLKIEERLTSTFHCYEMKGKWHLKETYWYKMSCNTDLKPMPQVEEDIEWVKWINEKEVRKLTSDTYNSIKEVINQVFD